VGAARLSGLLPVREPLLVGLSGLLKFEGAGIGNTKLHERTSRARVVLGLFGVVEGLQVTVNRLLVGIQRPGLVAGLHQVSHAALGLPGFQEMRPQRDVVLRIAPLERFRRAAVQSPPL
jgi:hypothetical protein